MTIFKLFSKIAIEGTNHSDLLCKELESIAVKAAEDLLPIVASVNGLNIFEWIDGNKYDLSAYGEYADQPDVMESWLTSFMIKNNLIENLLTCNESLQILTEEYGVGYGGPFRPTNYIDSDDDEAYENVLFDEISIKTLEDKMILLLAVIAHSMNFSYEAVTNHFNGLSDKLSFMYYNKNLLDRLDSQDSNNVDTEIKADQRSMMAAKIRSIVTGFRSPEEDLFLVRFQRTIPTSNTFNSQGVRDILIARRDLGALSKAFNAIDEMAEWIDLGELLKKATTDSRAEEGGEGIVSLSDIKSIALYLNDYCHGIDKVSYEKKPVAYWKEENTNHDQRWRTFCMDMYPPSYSFEKLTTYGDSFYEFANCVRSIQNWFPVSSAKVSGEALLHLLLYIFYDHRTVLNDAVKLSAICGYADVSSFNHAVEIAFFDLPDPSAILEAFIPDSDAIEGTLFPACFSDKSFQMLFLEQVTDNTDMSIGKTGSAPSIVAAMARA